MISKTVRVAVVQAAPAHLDIERSVERVAGFTAEAAAGGASLVVFGETWLPGYPAWIDHCGEVTIWNNSATKDVFARLRQNSITVPGDHATRLADVARSHNVTLVIGAHERVESGPGNGTLYNVLLTFAPDGELAQHHRKLVPTYTERLVWGPGDARGLDAVDTPSGRVGGLICWEHWMPLARHAMHESGEQIHVAVWPTAHEMHQLASRHYALEARCFVIAAGSIMRASELPSEFERPSHVRADDELLLRGGSAVIAPDGSYVAGPLFDEEKILFADIDLSAIDREKLTLDVSGHYHRPDLFELTTKRERR
ncbi:MAG: carbon-nitrogen hydrolase family protein [Acidobacteria bacterium]|nr:carbon-nitrogen hydrolase family protein [Acidobacteriota bacterium]